MGNMPSAPNRIAEAARLYFQLRRGLLPCGLIAAMTGFWKNCYFVLLERLPGLHISNHNAALASAMNWIA
jgi:hypothetical protein